ncbi:hypothetical protein BJX70DRAFT_391927 [Aspergillus crustosus]
MGSLGDIGDARPSPREDCGLCSVLERLEFVNLTTASLLVHQTKQTVEHLHQHQHDKQRVEILDWLSPTDYATRQNDLFSRRQEGTGEWFLRTSAGIPGAGKTVLASILINHLLHKFQSQKEIGIAYLCFSCRQQHEQTALVHGFPTIPAAVRSLYNQQRDRRTRPSFDEIAAVLHLTVAEHTNCYLVFDALDECEPSDGRMARDLLEVFKAQKAYNLNFLATSRKIPDILSYLEGKPSMDILAAPDNVKLYLRGRLQEPQSTVLRDRDIQEEVVKTIEGVAIRHALTALPSGSDAFDTAYMDAMSRIESQLADEERLAKQLSARELQHALAIKPEESDLDTDNTVSIEDILSVCSGLVTVDDQSDVIRLVHHTTQEFFDRNRELWFPTAHRHIAEACLTYLQYDNIEAGPCGTSQEYDARLHEYPLHIYASHHWATHAKKLDACTQNLLTFKRLGDAWWWTDTNRGTTGLHLAVYYRWASLVQNILAAHPDQINALNSKGRTPLLWAAQHGSNDEAIVSLGQGTSRLVKSDKGKTLLAAAAMQRSEGATGAVFDERIGFGRNPLNFIAEPG